MTIIPYIDRKTGEKLEENVPGGGMLKWLYNWPCGKLTLHALFKRKFFSDMGGWYMDRKRSKKRIPTFISQYNIDMSEYVDDVQLFSSFNEFFVRKIKPEKRPIGVGVVSPADGRVLAFENLKDVREFFVKGSEFNLESYLRNIDLANKYKEGSMVIVRLAPVDYHRFHFPDSGKISKTELINGKYFSVSPLALKKSLRIFCQNKRTYSVLETEEHGDILISEVGATMVGSIIQSYEAESRVDKGVEKGYFAFGGSTLVLLFEKDKVKINTDLLENTKKGLETRIFMGESIAN